MQNLTDSQSNPIKLVRIRLHSEVREKLHTPLTFEGLMIKSYNVTHLQDIFKKEKI